MLITTTFHGPTNTRGSRIIATSPHHKVRLTFAYNPALSTGGDEGSNHLAAARALVLKLNGTPDTLEHAAPTLVGWIDANSYAYDARPAYAVPTPLTRAEIVNGTGFAPDAVFVQVR